MGSYLTDEDLLRCRSIGAAQTQAVHDIIDQVASETGVNRSVLVGIRKSKTANAARQIVMFVALREGIPDTIVAKVMNRDRSTISAGAKREELARKNPGTGAAVQEYGEKS